MQYFENKENTVRFVHVPLYFIVLYVFVLLTFAIKLKNANHISHWNISIFCDQWNMMSYLNMFHEKMYGFVSYPLFGFTLVMKLSYFNFGNHWNSLIFLMKKDMTRNLNIVWFCFISIVWVHFSQKIRNFNFWNTWCQIWVCPVKQCVIWFKLFDKNCDNKLRNVDFKFYLNNSISFVRSKFVPNLFCLICIFWHYYRNSSKSKRFLIILRYIEIL